MISPTTHLVLHNIAIITSIVILLGVALFVFLKGVKKEANITGALSVFFIAVFFTSHVIGININDPVLSKKVLMLNILMIFIGTFNLHAILALFNKARAKRLLINIAHLSAVLISVFFFVFPDSFLLNSIPKMYFPNYYNPGDLNWIRMIFLFGIIVPYCFHQIILIYRTSSDATEKKQVKYFALSMLVGYSVGFIPNFLVYNINIDPLWGAPTAIIFAIPFVYGIIQYKMFNIKIIAKQALIYSLAVAIIGIGIAFLNYSSNWIEGVYPNFPVWTIYLSSALLAVTISAFVWQRLKESDLLKYEFVTTMTHRLRTPLTGIRWATDNLTSKSLPGDVKIQLDYIKKENTKLVELTNLLINISKTENDSYEYHINRGNLSKTLDEVINLLIPEALEKNISINRKYDNELFAFFDDSRIKFVVQVLIENSINYSPNGSNINVYLASENKRLVCKVEDFGIGIGKDEMTKLFTKFYRGKRARLEDTEGLGIGLFMAREILFRQHGKIWAESIGENSGCTFYFSLPIDR